MTSPTAFADIIQCFVQTVTTGAPPSLRQLARALDQLPILVHYTPGGEPADSDVEAPEKDYRALCNSLRLRFPNLGYYVAANPLDEPGAPSTVGDAIDDLADIVGDLYEVIWRYENFGSDDAFWYFRFLFQVHWGRHLRELSLYLHATLAANDGWDAAGPPTG